MVIQNVLAFLDIKKCLGKNCFFELLFHRKMSSGAHDVIRALIHETNPINPEPKSEPFRYCTESSPMTWPYVISIAKTEEDVLHLVHKTFLVSACF